jgi:hypothetical protein
MSQWLTKLSSALDTLDTAVSEVADGSDTKMTVSLQNNNADDDGRGKGYYGDNDDNNNTSNGSCTANDHVSVDTVASGVISGITVASDNIAKHITASPSDITRDMTPSSPTTVVTSRTPAHQPTHQSPHNSVQSISSSRAIK